MKKQEYIDIFDSILNAFKKVIEDWGIVELLFFIIFIPFSLFYLGMRIVQEYK